MIMRSPSIHNHSQISLAPVQISLSASDLHVQLYHLSLPNSPWHLNLNSTKLNLLLPLSTSLLSLFTKPAPSLNLFFEKGVFIVLPKPGDQDAILDCPLLYLSDSVIYDCQQLM